VGEGDIRKGVRRYELVQGEADEHVKEMEMGENDLNLVSIHYPLVDYPTNAMFVR
jgi:hypothetical protein